MQSNTNTEGGKMSKSEASAKALGFASVTDMLEYFTKRLIDGGLYEGLREKAAK
jgi:hypothetical protein